MRSFSWFNVPARTSESACFPETVSGIPKFTRRKIARHWHYSNRLIEIKRNFLLRFALIRLSVLTVTFQPALLLHYCQ